MLNGCKNFTHSAKIKSPISTQFGNKGEQPTAVWSDYDWKIQAIGVIK